MNISEPFIRRPIATALLMAAIGFVGLVSYPFLPVAPLPQVDFPTIRVDATLQGASAETMAASQHRLRHRWSASLGKFQGSRN